MISDNVRWWKEGALSTQECVERCLAEAYGDASWLKVALDDMPSMRLSDDELMALVTKIDEIIR